MAKFHTPSSLTIMTMADTPDNIMGTKTDNKRNKEVTLKHELRYVFWAMGVFGLYHTPKAWRERSSFTVYYAHKFYCLIIQLLLWLNGIRMVVGLWFGDESFFAMKITVGAWYFQCAFNASIWYWICRTNKMPFIMNLWQSCCQSSPESRLFNTAITSASFRRRMVVILMGAIAFIFSNFVLLALAQFGPSESFRNDTQFLSAPFTERCLPWELAIVASEVIASAAYVLPPAFLLILCTILSHQFQLLTVKFSNSITEERKFTGCLMSLRRQHQHLSKTVFVIDEAFSFYLAITFACCIILSCFGMYQLVVAKSFSSSFAVFMTTFWFLVVSLKFSLIGVVTAQVAEKVSSQ